MSLRITFDEHPGTVEFFLGATPFTVATIDDVDGDDIAVTVTAATGAGGREGIALFFEGLAEQLRRDATEATS